MSRIPEVPMGIFHQLCHTRMYTINSGSTVQAYGFEIFYQVTTSTELDQM
jgi:hypothetical protein